ncbi:CopG family transcriptional regulator [Roseivivax marinus]|uniref:CopG family transcriptional regulator n=1 Tax=Roseivivax marinus TaxID=1379903 RepID=W4HFT7_9RHOB|nr:CopG family transcriptional regulator [Roseivivax marinus]
MAPHDPGKKQEGFRRDTLDAWEEYRTAGLYASAEKVDAWLSSWGSDNEKPAPECRNSPKAPTLN